MFTKASAKMLPVSDEERGSVAEKRPPRASSHPPEQLPWGPAGSGLPTPVPESAGWWAGALSSPLEVVPVQRPEPGGGPLLADIPSCSPAAAQCLSSLPRLSFPINAHPLRSRHLTAGPHEHILPLASSVCPQSARSPCPALCPALTAPWAAVAGLVAVTSGS